MRKLLALAALALTVACHDGSTEPLSFPGTYDLTTVNNASLPFIYEQDATGMSETLSEVFNANTNGTFSVTYTERYTNTGQPSQTVTATATGFWSLNGSVLTLSGATGTGTISAGFDGRVMTIVNAGATYRYVRR
jgi:hypothetical protein